MAQTLIATERVTPNMVTSDTDGQIVVNWSKLLWLLGHGALGTLGVIAYFHWVNLMVFLVLTALTVCAGHSVGMHRLLIHRSFKTHQTTRTILIWLGTLVGMAGPCGMIWAHDMRDWHQRQVTCPPHPSHDAGFWKDAFWQLGCVFVLRHPPDFAIEADVRDDRILMAIERTWMLQQLPVAIVLYALGGWGFVLWGICLRVFVSLTGHWMVGHFAHRRGHQEWIIEGVAVQGFNLHGLGLITSGENWHGNHHAFPHSAKLGVTPGQMDPGFWLIRLLEKCGLAWDIKLPESEPARDGLIRV